MQEKIGAEYNARGAQRSCNVADVGRLPADSIGGSEGEGGGCLEWKNTSWPRSQELHKQGQSYISCGKTKYNELQS